MMKMNKEKFLKTELGGSLQECITAWDKWLEIGDRKAALWCQAQWEVYPVNHLGDNQECGAGGNHVYCGDHHNRF